MIRRMALTAVTAALATPFLPIVAEPAVAAQAHGLTKGQYRRRTLKLGTLARLTCEIALRVAENPAVKQFATFEVAEQTTLAKVLTDRDYLPPVQFTAAEQQVLGQLSAIVGGNFDRLYVDVQTQGHQELKEVQLRYLQDGKDRDPIHIAKLALTVIEEHLTHLADLKALLNPTPS